MSQVRAYPPELRAEALRLREAGMTYAEISDAIQIKKCTLASWFCRRGFVAPILPGERPRHHVRRPVQAIHEVMVLRQEGMTQEGISKKLGIPQSTINSWLQAHTLSGPDRRCEGD